MKVTAVNMMCLNHCFLLVVLLGIFTNDVISWTFKEPHNFDWRTKGVVSPVKNQGRVGSSLSFDILGAMESFSAIHTGRLTRLSLSELIDCCNPKFAKMTFDCVVRIGGLCSESDYPSHFGSCHNNTCTPQVKPSGSRAVPSGNETALQTAVLKNPVVVIVDASHTSFQLYTGGIYREKACKTTMLDHTLLLVGYGEQDGEKYWICQNTWGASWGMHGYIHIAKDEGNMCGIATAAMYPV